jgi:hypothetical protein
MYKKKPVKEKSSGFKPLLIAAAVVLMVLGTGWLAYGYMRGDDLSALNELREKMRDENLSDDQRKDLRDQMRTQWDQLSDDQQQQMRQSREEHWNREMQTRLNQYFAMAPADREKELDKQIDEMEKRREEWEKRRQERNRDDNGQRDRGNAGGGGGRGGPGGGGRGPQTGEQRLQRSKQRLDSSTPELRGMRSDYMREMGKRREARGLPPFGRGGWR